MKKGDLDEDNYVLLKFRRSQLIIELIDSITLHRIKSSKRPLRMTMATAVKKANFPQLLAHH